MSVYFHADHHHDSLHHDEESHLGDALEAILMISVGIVLIVSLLVI